MALLKVGDKIPNFSCFDDKENLITNKDLIGKKTIIFFYPRANTPGCTAQACNLSENYSELSKVGFTIIGVSADKVKSQSSFSSKFGGFPYPLLADTEKKLINACANITGGGLLDNLNRIIPNNLSLNIDLERFGIFKLTIPELFESAKFFNVKLLIILFKFFSK